MDKAVKQYIEKLPKAKLLKILLADLEANLQDDTQFSVETLHEIYIKGFKDVPYNKKTLMQLQKEAKELFDSCNSIQEVKEEIESILSPAF